MASCERRPALLRRELCETRQRNLASGETVRCIRCGKPIDEGGDLCAPCAPLYWQELQERTKGWPTCDPEPACELPPELV